MSNKPKPKLGERTTLYLRGIAVDTARKLRMGAAAHDQTIAEYLDSVMARIEITSRAPRAGLRA